MNNFRCTILLYFLSLNIKLDTLISLLSRTQILLIMCSRGGDTLFVHIFVEVNVTLSSCKLCRKVSLSCFVLLVPPYCDLVPEKKPFYALLIF
jgi:cellulose synthase/poly-beta-1,6-N-acetylglucosamine synthase-like glycosyltransferase